MLKMRREKKDTHRNREWVEAKIYNKKITLFIDKKGCITYVDVDVDVDVDILLF